MDAETTSAHEALMQFLYLAPIGLVQTTVSGQVEMLNPMSARLLMPLSPEGGLDNLFDTLDRVAPELRELVRRFEPQTGAVCEGLYLNLPATDGAPNAPRVLSISILKLPGARLRISLADITAEVERERRGMDQRLSQASRTDALTQLPNRAAVKELLENVLADADAGRGGEFAVLYLSQYPSVRPAPGTSRSSTGSCERRSW